MKKTILIQKEKVIKNFIAKVRSKIYDPEFENLFNEIVLNIKLEQKGKR